MSPGNPSHRQPPETHRIFKACVACGFDTLKTTDFDPDERPGYECPHCKASSFTFACLRCSFQSSPDCPLSQLLRYDDETDQRETKPFVNASVQGSIKAEDGDPSEKAAQTLKEEERNEHAVLETEEDSISLPRPLICSQCCQKKCDTCQPGYTNFIVDMNDFSKDFGEEMRLCTMCEHWLCPGSELVVIFRCRECGHEGCDVCLDEGSSEGEEEQWHACCRCARERRREEHDPLKDEAVEVAGPSIPRIVVTMH